MHTHATHAHACMHMQRSVAPLACGARVCTCEDRARRVCAYTRDESMSMCSCTRGVYTDEEETGTHDEGQSVSLRTASVRVVAHRRGAYSTRAERPAPGAWSPRCMRGVCEAVHVREEARGDYLRKEGGARCTRGKQHTMSGQHNATRAATLQKLCTRRCGRSFSARSSEHVLASHRTG